MLRQAGPVSLVVTAGLRQKSIRMISRPSISGAHLAGHSPKVPFAAPVWVTSDPGGIAPRNCVEEETEPDTHGPSLQRKTMTISLAAELHKCRSAHRLARLA